MTLTIDNIFSLPVDEPVRIEIKRQEYDANRYKLNMEKYKQRTVEYRLRLKEDIPRMKAKILEQLKTGKKIWLTNKTMIKYDITHDKINKTYS